MAKQKKPIRPRSGKPGNAAPPSQRLLRILLASFAGGIGVCILLMAILALAFTKMPIPLTLVRPMACLSAAAGSAVSGLLLARGMGKQLLLCGLGCGAFYSVCQLGAALAMTGSLPTQSADFMLPVALLLSGTLGGALAAMRPSR